MKKAIQQELPPGWNEKKVRELIAYYDTQADEEGAAEIEAADAAPGETWMSVPTELVPVIARLIQDHEQKASNSRARPRQATEARSRRARKPARR